MHTSYLRARRGARPDAGAELRRGRGPDDLRPVRGDRARRFAGRSRRDEERADYERVEAALRRARRDRRPRRPVVAPRRRAAGRPLVRRVAPQRERAARPSSGRSRWARLRSPTARSSTPRCLAELRKAAAVGERGFYAYDLWESLQVAEGSAEVAERLAAGLDGRVRLGAEVDVASPSLAAAAASASYSGEELAAAGGRLRAPRRRATRDRDRGRCPERLGVASPAAERPRGEGRGRLRPARSGATSDANGLSRGRVPARVDVAAARRRALRSRATRAARPAARRPRGRSRRRDPRRARRGCSTRRGAGRRSDVHLRLWGTDPYTRGYVTHWWPGDVLRVGPLHGTHAPPFYVCGSDQWVAGYMEGAVRTGRAAAAAALGARLSVRRQRSFTPRRASSRAPARWRASPSSPPLVTRCPTLPLSG